MPSITFSSAVRWGNRLYCWNTIEERRRNFNSSALLILLLKSMVKLPSVNANTPFSGRSSKFKQRKKVVLPEPDGPRMATTSPLLISKSMPFNTWWPLKLF